MIILTGSVISPNNFITLSRWSNELFAGQFIYCPAFPPGTAVASLDKANLKAVLNKTATASYTGSVQFTSANPGLYVERCEALKDVKAIVDERGDYIRIFLRDEADVTRDAYNSIEKRDQDRILEMKAYPIEVRPTEKQLEKAGIREGAEITIWTAMYDWIAAGVNFNDIEFGNRSTVMWGGNIYEIRDKNIVNQFADTFLYLTLGLFKR